MRRDSGPSHKVISSVRAAPVVASTPTGSRILRRPMPSAVSAMISLSADMRPNPSSTPIRMAIGIVNASTPGKMRQKQLRDLGPGAGMADEQRGQSHQLRYEKHKRENHEPKERMTKYFADDVAIQNAHDGNAECNMSLHASRSAACREMSR